MASISGEGLAALEIVFWEGVAAIRLDPLAKAKSKGRKTIFEIVISRFLDFAAIIREGARRQDESMVQHKPGMSRFPGPKIGTKGTRVL
jgi:hypothetical protein